MQVPSTVTKQPQINAAVAEVLRELAPAVQQIRYEIAPDWTGQLAVFFRVLLSDEASSGKNRRDVGPRVIWGLSDKLDLPTLGMFPYFEFRSQSEQAKANEPDWA